jgi:hypothetical protein
LDLPIQRSTKWEFDGLKFIPISTNMQIAFSICLILMMHISRLILLFVIHMTPPQELFEEIYRYETDVKINEITLLILNGVYRVMLSIDSAIDTQK